MELAIQTNYCGLMEVWCRKSLVKVGLTLFFLPLFLPYYGVTAFNDVLAQAIVDAEPEIQGEKRLCKPKTHYVALICVLTGIYTTIHTHRYGKPLAGWVISFPYSNAKDLS